MPDEVESVQPALEDRIVDVLFLERLALRVDERRPRRRVHVHELREMPEVQLQEVFGGTRGRRIAPAFTSASERFSRGSSGVTRVRSVMRTTGFAARAASMKSSVRVFIGP